MRDRLIELLQGADKKCNYTEQCENCVGFDKGNECVNHLIADHLLANGVIVPPCKVNDDVWLVYSPPHPADPADKGKWFMMQDGVQRIICGAKGLSIETWNVGTIPAKEIGIKLFFNEADAEKALAEREGKG